MSRLGLKSTGSLFSFKQMSGFLALLPITKLNPGKSKVENGSSTLGGVVVPVRNRVVPIQLTSLAIRGYSQIQPCLLEVQMASVA